MKLMGLSGLASDASPVKRARGAEHVPIDPSALLFPHMPSILLAFHHVYEVWYFAE